MKVKITVREKLENRYIFEAECENEETLNDIHQRLYEFYNIDEKILEKAIEEMGGKVQMVKILPNIPDDLEVESDIVDEWLLAFIDVR